MLIIIMLTVPCHKLCHPVLCVAATRVRTARRAMQ